MSRAFDADVIVIGGGISGLACAWNLQQRGLNVIVLESQSRAGGCIGSGREQGYLVEAGPNSALDTTPLIARLLEETGIAGERIASSRAAAKRYILRDGKLMALPMSPVDFIATRLFSLRAKLRLLKEPFIGAASVAEETVAGFVRRRLGTEFLEYAINPFVAGVYAGDPEVLSVKAAFPRLYELEQAHGSLIRGYLAGGAARKRNPEKSKHAAPMFAFRNGMQTLTDAIAGKLAHVELATAALKVVPGPDCHSVTVRSPHGLRDFRARAVVLATPAHAAAGLVGGFSPAAGVALTTIPYPPVAVAVCGYLRDAIGHPLDGFGVLVPQRERGQTLGTLFSSSLFEHRAPSGKVMLTTFVGGTRQPSLARLDEAEIAAIVQASHVATLSARNPPDFVRIKRWEQAIPQYTLGHHNRISAVDAAERAFPGVFFCANYRGGVAIGDCVKAAHGMAGKVENFLRGS